MCFSSANTPLRRWDIYAEANAIREEKWKQFVETKGMHHQDSIYNRYYYIHARAWSRKQHEIIDLLEKYRLKQTP